MAISKITTNSITDDAVTTAKVNPAQTDITSVGTLTSFRSTGIDDNADALAITIDSSERVGIGTASPAQLLHVKADNPGGKIRLEMGQTGVANTDVTGEIEFYQNDSSGAGVNASIQGICTNSAGKGALLIGTGTTSTTERVRIDGDGHVQVKTGGLTVDTVGQLLGVGTNNPSHAIQVHHTAPEIMLEETSTGGSKRISMGVESDGTPFISAEQSGGQIEYQLSGNATHLMTDNSLQGRRSGDRFIMGRGPVTGQTLADEATTTLATLSGCMSQIILIVDSGGGGGVFWCTYQSTVTKLAGSGDYASSDSDGSTCVFKSSNSHAVTLKNRQGGDHTYYVLITSAYI